MLERARELRKSVQETVGILRETAMVRLKEAREFWGEANQLEGIARPMQVSSTIQPQAAQAVQPQPVAYAATPQPQPQPAGPPQLVTEGTLQMTPQGPVVTSDNGQPQPVVPHAPNPPAPPESTPPPAPGMTAHPLGQEQPQVRNLITQFLLENCRPEPGILDMFKKKGVPEINIQAELQVMQQRGLLSSVVMHGVKVYDLSPTYRGALSRHNFSDKVA